MALKEKKPPNANHQFLLFTTKLDVKKLKMVLI